MLNDTVDGKNPANHLGVYEILKNGIVSISTGAGFLPSTDDDYFTWEKKTFRRNHPCYIFHFITSFQFLHPLLPHKYSPDWVTKPSECSWKLPFTAGGRKAGDFGGILTYTFNLIYLFERFETWRVSITIHHLSFKKAKGSCLTIANLHGVANASLVCWSESLFQILFDGATHNLKKKSTVILQYEKSEPPKFFQLASTPACCAFSE